jgi:hypothetical protein
MNSPEEPPRLHASDSTSPELRAAVRALRADLPDPDRLHELRARLPVTRTSVRLKVWQRMLLSLGVGMVLLGAVLAVRRSLRVSHTNHNRALHVVSQPAVRVSPQVAAPPMVLPPVPVVSVSTGSETVPVQTEHRPRTSPMVRDVDATETCVLSDHFASLSRAQMRMRAGDTRDALAICARDERRCPRGPLSEERERLTIEALFSLGRQHEAAVKFDHFERSFPRSAYRERLEELRRRHDDER